MAVVVNPARQDSTTWTALFDGVVLMLKVEHWPFSFSGDPGQMKQGRPHFLLHQTLLQRNGITKVHTGIQNLSQKNQIKVK